MLADFHFLRPWSLLALLPVMLFLALLYYHRRSQSPWHNLIAQHLQPVLLGAQLLQSKQPLALPLLALSWLLATIALAGPSVEKLPQPAFALKKATVLVLDMSMSMRATDMAPNRLTQQRFAALDFAAQLKEGELALLSFAGDAFVISPLTPDHNNIRLLVPDLTSEIMPAQGSNLLAALTQADKLLRQAGYPRGDVVVHQCETPQSRARLTVTPRADGGVTAGWTHYLAFDLFVGLWIARDGDAKGISRLVQAPVLLATFMAGPLGLLVWLILREPAAQRRLALHFCGRLCCAGGQRTHA